LFSLLPGVVDAAATSTRMGFSTRNSLGFYGGSAGC
jgi:hypothetical protein